MALIKKLSRFGYQAEYLRLTRIDRFDELAKEAVFRFSLYKDRAASEAGEEPLVADAAKLKLTGAAFSKWFGKGKADADMIKRQAYLAARVEPIFSWGPGQLNLSDAVDV